MRTTRQRLIRLTALTAVVLFLAGCGDDRTELGTDGADRADVAVPAGTPTYSGEITEVTPFVPVTDDCVEPGELDPDGSVSSDDPPICTDPATAPLGHALVEEEPGRQSGDKISLYIARDTPILRDSGGGDPVAVGFDGLAVGVQVDVWIDGPVADSYPQQGQPDVIVIRR